VEILNKPLHTNDAFTGLEASLVLIAFIVVASVFSYVALGAGFFSTQKSQKVIMAGIEQTSSNFAIKGDIYGIANNDKTKIIKIQFDLGPAVGGSILDLSRAGITWSTNNLTPARLNFTRSAPVPGQWTVIKKITDSEEDYLIKDNGIATILVFPPYGVSSREQFTMEISPESGSSISISRTIPAGFENNVLLY
jgi:archaeal flagellin FlaB